jgi:beta-barrel assembly-enhancing protease
VSARALRLSVVGLGTLALSCAGMRMPTLPTSVGGIVQTAGSASRTEKERTECEKLNASPSLEEEYALGGSVALNWVQRGGGLIPLEENRELLRYINIVGKNLGAQSPRPDLKWTFGVLRSVESFNAISAPGGYVFVTLGLLRGVENEAQLAGVLAHEIAHITGKHVLNRYTDVKVGQCKRAAFLSGGSKLGSQTGLDLTPAVVDDLLAAARNAGASLNLNKHVEMLGSFTDDLVGTLTEGGLDQKDEFAADEQAVRMLVSAGYDPREYTEFLAKIPDSRNVFAHHPRKVDRVKKLVALLNANKDSGQDFPELAASTEGLVQPPLPPEFASVGGSVARDRP